MFSIHYCGLIAFLAGVSVLCIFMLFCGYFLGGRSNSSSKNKNVPFESGIKSVEDARVKFSVKFYLIAMAFVIFDVEGIYIYIWSISIRDVGWLGFAEIFVFIVILLASLVYSIRIGMFNWVLEQSLRSISRVNCFNPDITKLSNRSNERK